MSQEHDQSGPNPNSTYRIVDIDDLPDALKAIYLSNNTPRHAPLPEESMVSGPSAVHPEMQRTNTIGAFFGRHKAMTGLAGLALVVGGVKNYGNFTHADSTHVNQDKAVSLSALLKNAKIIKNNAAVPQKIPGASAQVTPSTAVAPAEVPNYPLGNTGCKVFAKVEVNSVVPVDWYVQLLGRSAIEKTDKNVWLTFTNADLTNSGVSKAVVDKSYVEWSACLTPDTKAADGSAVSNLTVDRPTPTSQQTVTAKAENIQLEPKMHLDFGASNVFPFDPQTAKDTFVRIDPTAAGADFTASNLLFANSRSAVLAASANAMIAESYKQNVAAINADAKAAIISSMDDIAKMTNIPADKILLKTTEGNPADPTPTYAQLAEPVDPAKGYRIDFQDPRSIKTTVYHKVTE